MSELTSDAPMRTLTLAGGGELAFRTAGDPSRPALVLIHGFPSSSHTFREVIGPLSQQAFVVAPDLPGFGRSDVLDEPSFKAFADAVETLLETLGVGDRVLYLHDFGAPVGLELAMQAPERVRGLIVQNANAHASGLGPEWAQTQAYWAKPNVETEAAATAHLTREGTRDQYVAGVPEDIAARIDPEVWEADWRVMSRPGRMATQRALIRDYGRYVDRFGEIAAYLEERQPPAVMVWGRHDAFFALPETVSWMQALPRMEAHVLDGGHFLLETHADRAAALMGDFLAGTLGEG